MARLLQRRLVFVIGLLSASGFCLGASTTNPPSDADPELKAVASSLPGSLYSTNPVVVLSSADTGTTIRYTLDGSIPDLNAPVYHEPLEMTNTTVLTAAVFGPAGRSAVRSETFTLVDASVAEFSSNLPLVIIDTFGNGIESDTRTDVSIHLMDTNHGRATLNGPAGLDSRALIKLRGHSSLRYPKRSYGLKLREPRVLRPNDRPRHAQRVGLGLVCSLPGQDAHPGRADL